MSIITCVAVAGVISILVMLDRKTDASDDDDASPAESQPDKPDPFEAANQKPPNSGDPFTDAGSKDPEENADPPPPPKPPPKPKPAIVTEDITIPLYSGTRPIGHAKILTGKRVEFLEINAEGKARILYEGNEYTAPKDSILIDE